MKIKTNLLRNSFIWISASTLPLSSFGTVTTTATPWQPYIGASVGYNTLNVKNNRLEDTRRASIGTSEANFSKSTFILPIFFGIEKPVSSQFSVSGEIFGFLDNKTLKTNEVVIGDGRQESFKRRYSYGMKIKGGYYLNPNSKVYIGAGVENSDFEYHCYNGGSGENLKQRKSIWGMPLSIGTEIDIASKSKMRLEYTHTIYKSWSTGNIGTKYIETRKLKPVSHIFTLGFSYFI